MKVWCKCPECGKEWSTMMIDFVNRVTTYPCGHEEKK